MEVNLKLRHRCIETEIKREYNQSIGMYFKSGNHSLLEKKIELLKKALELLDFRALRNCYSELCQGTDASVVLSDNDDDGELSITINGLSIMLKYKDQQS